MSIALVCDKCGNARRLEETQLHPVILPPGWVKMQLTQNAGAQSHGGTVTQHTCEQCSRAFAPNAGELTIINPRKLRP